MQYDMKNFEKRFFLDTFEKLLLTIKISSSFDKTDWNLYRKFNVKKRNCNGIEIFDDEYSSINICYLRLKYKKDKLIKNLKT